MKRSIAYLAFGLAILAGALADTDALRAQPDQRRPVFITDRHGERWDVTQAMSLGFKPDQFQYGIGRYAFSPLSDAHLESSSRGVFGRTRVIGVAGENEAQAYSVRKLARHEIANTHIDGRPIAVGY